MGACSGRTARESLACKGYRSTVRVLTTRRETVIAVAFNAVSRVTALETCISWVLPVACQTLAMLPTPACRKISAPFRLGFADLAVISERCIHCRVSKRRMLNLQSGRVMRSDYTEKLSRRPPWPLALRIGYGSADTAGGCGTLRRAVAIRPTRADDPPCRPCIILPRHPSR
jgi:hypothetical protein